MSKLKDFIRLCVKHRWHLHSLAFFVSPLLMWASNKYNWFYLGGSGDIIVMRTFLWGILAPTIFAFLLEYAQNKIFGANTDSISMWDSKRDILVTTIAALLGAILELVLIG